MTISRSAVRDLYTRNADQYASFVAVFRACQGLRAFLLRSNLVRPGIRVLDAGCGAGMATFALADAFRSKHMEYGSIDAFDLTPALLERFRRKLNARGIPRVEFQQAHVL